MKAILTIVAMSTFAASLAMRSLDPMLPQVAQDFAVGIDQAALLSAAFVFAYAVVQPFLGAAADLFGKTRLIVICLALLGITLAMSAFATSFQMLLVMRVLAGAVSGGVFPIALGIAGDLVPAAERQVAIGRFLGSAMAGNLMGATLAGLIADAAGWRTVLSLLAIVITSCAVASHLAFRKQSTAAHRRLAIAELTTGYRSIFRNPNAKICFASVMLEGIAVFGLFPFVAALLAQQGEQRYSIAGVVIGCFAIGGIAYSLAVSRVLAVMGQRRMMAVAALGLGVLLAALALAPPWQVQMAIFFGLGFAFYSVHGSLQLFATELAPNARASATALHAFFFFLGQAIGPVVYGFGLGTFGTIATLLAAAMLIASVGTSAAALLRDPKDAV